MRLDSEFILPLRFRIRALTPTRMALLALAEREVADYFERNGQLATEHPRIEGDQAGRFALARLGAQVPVRDDVQLRQLMAQRSELNTEIDALRLRRDAMTPDDYQSELLQKMLSLAMLEDEIEQREGDLAQ